MPKKFSMTPPPKIKKKEQKKQEEAEKFIHVTQTLSTAQYHQNIKKDIQYMRKIIMQWSVTTNNFIYQLSEYGILTDYLNFFHQYTEYDQFDRNFSLIPLQNVNLEHISSVDLIYKSINIFRKCQWPVRFSRKFLSRINDFNSNQIKYTLAFIMLLAKGKFNSKKMVRSKWGYVQPIDTHCSSYHRYFSMKIFRQKNIIVHIGVQKLPVASRNDVIKRYQYRNYLFFLDLVNDAVLDKRNLSEERMTVFKNLINDDVAKRDHVDELQIDISKWSKNSQYFFLQQQNPYTNTNDVFDLIFPDNTQNNFQPLPFKIQYVSTNQASTLIFNKQMKRWISQDHISKLQKKAINQYQKKFNQEMVKKFVDFQSAKTLVQLLTKIPNFKVKLTDQQKDTIGQNGNVLVIGRSGTGKTTCAVLRLFSIQMLFKIRLSLYNKKNKQEIKDKNCSADDIDKSLGLHCVFLTASPVLTNEIQRYYKKLTENIKDQLEKKRKRVQQERKIKEQQKRNQLIKEQNEEQEAEQIQQEKIIGKEEQIVQKQQKIIQKEKKIIQQQINKEQKIQEIKIEQQQDIPITLQKIKSIEQIQQQKQIGKQLHGINFKEQLQNQQFQQDQIQFDQIKDQFEEKMKKYQSLDDLQQHDYPGFFTVKSYIMMIDGVLPKPFFIRNKKEVIGEDSKAAWHNEKKGVMMIENYHRSENQQEYQDFEQLDQDINYSDEEQLEHQYMRQLQLRQNREKQQLTRKLQSKSKRSKMAFQVDYDYFVTHFWPNMQKRYYSNRNITAHLVWTQIYSTIKGSAGSHLYAGQYLPQRAYLEQSTNKFLLRNEKLDVYETFCQYERWKIKAGGYDIMDCVNYILNYIRFRGYNGPEIHYVMIDQVQDLPHAIVYLLSKTANYGVFYSGDTAQTIAKGVGFRFCDLKSLFDRRLFDISLTLKKPIVKQLTVNFRSHNNILQLANCIVSCLEILFPKTIDRLQKQISNLQGPKPIILQESDQDLLFYVLCGKQDSQNIGLKKPALQFGCQQVIIVRDQDSKKNIPAMLQHALCLTIYQAKGLEFNDVILFNFFTQSKCPDKWQLIKNLNIIETTISKKQYNKQITKHNMQDQKESNEIIDENEQNTQCILTHNQKDQMYIIKKLVGNMKHMIKDINDYAQLCSELKLLYTAITRPRKTLIIYDQQAGCRKKIQRIWKQLNIVKIINRNIVEKQFNKKDNQNQNQNKQDKQQIQIFKKIIKSSDKIGWKKQGLKMYSRGYFEQAIKCFECSQDKILLFKAKAYQLADNATKKLIDVESQRNAIKQKFHLYQTMQENARKKLKKELKIQQRHAFQDFIKASIIFENLELFKQAGQCYFSGKQYQKSYECFFKIGMNKQMAQCLEMLGNYKQASQYYSKSGQYLKVIQCLDMNNQWQNILIAIQKHEKLMSQHQKQTLLKKYSSLALQSLVFEIEFENDPQKQKIQQQVQKQKNLIIKQGNSQDQISDDSNDSQQKAQRQYRKKQADQLLLRIKKSDQPITNFYNEEQNQQRIKQSIYDQLDEEQSIQNKQQEQNNKQKYKQEQSFTQLNKTQKIGNYIEQKKIIKQEKQIQKQKQQQSLQQQSLQKQSFVNLNEIQISKQQQQQDSFINLNITDKNKSKKKEIKKNEQINEQLQQQQQQNSDNFSNLNLPYNNNILLQPDIQSIKSMVDPQDLWIKNALSQINPLTYTQYSVINDNQNYNINVKIIKTKGNIFVQDQIMKKIIQIVSIINNSVQQFFKTFKGYQSLLTITKNQQENKQQLRQQIDDFEDINIDFIHIILDTLESFKLYKLCLFVCNRYHLPDKAGRYLLSISMKYSTNCQVNTTIVPNILSPSQQRKIQLEKGILASIAVHGMLQNVNPQFLKIKISNYDSKNGLKIYFIQGLILQGLYKKTIFMLNYKQACKILNNYSDFTTYFTIINSQQYRNKFIIDIQKQILNEQEIQYIIIMFRKFLKQNNRYKKLINYPIRYYRQFGDIKEQQKQYTKIQKDIFQKFFPLTFHLHTNLQIFISKWKQNCSSYFFKLINGFQYQIWDLVSVIGIILLKQQLYHEIIKRFQIPHFIHFYRCLKQILLTLKKLHSNNTLIIIKSFINLYQCTIISNCPSMNFLNQSYCLLNRISCLSGKLSDEIKYKKKQAFFYQQDFNFILIQTKDILPNIIQHIQVIIIKFYQSRINYRSYKNSGFQPCQYFLLKDAEQIISVALKEQIIRMFKNQKIKNKSNQVKISKNKPILMDYKMRGRQDHIIYLQNESDYDYSSMQKQIEKELTHTAKYFIPINMSQLTYLRDSMLRIFLKKSKWINDNIICAKQLYCTNNNDVYREYVEKRGGFNLYDAIEFKKFYRLDLYADNILSVMKFLPFKDRAHYISQITLLLLIQYKSKCQQGKEFKMQITGKFRRYLEKLILIDPLIYQYTYRYSTDTNIDQLIQIIIDYFHLTIYEQEQKDISFAELILIYIINCKPNELINKKINQIIPNYPKFFAIFQECQSSDDFIKQKIFYLDRKQKNKSLMKLYQIRIKCQNNHQNNVLESQRDYKIETKIIQGRKKAIKKISYWWYKNKNKLIDQFTHKKMNYYQYFLSKKYSYQSNNNVSENIMEFRIVRLLCEKNYNCIMHYKILTDCMIARNNLINFYLTNTITLSLDFHFILITLNKIEEQWFKVKQLVLDSQKGLESTDFNEVRANIDQIMKEFQVWKNDNKWLKQKKVNIKTRKVFEVKWMTKVIRRKANLRKQNYLIKKKKMLKK